MQAIFLPLLLAAQAALPLKKFLSGKKFFLEGEKNFFGVEVWRVGRIGVLPVDNWVLWLDWAKKILSFLQVIGITGKKFIVDGSYKRLCQLLGLHIRNSRGRKQSAAPTFKLHFFAETSGGTLKRTLKILG